MSAKARLPPITRSPTAGIQSGNTTSFQKYQGVAGPHYQLTLTGDPTKHCLPAPKSLKPYVDIKAGTMDTWPAYATAQATTTVNSYNQRQHGTNAVDNSDQHQSIIPKPKFLEQLESFLKKELRNLDCSQTGPSELRLQAFREVFEYLIQDFKTYRPLLSAIKNEYEMMLSHQRQQIRELQPLKSMLVTVSEQCDQKVMALRGEERQEMAELKQENRQLQDTISTMKQEHVALQEQIEKLQEEVAAEYRKYRDECDARKLLVSDINDLKYQQEDNQKNQAGAQEAVVESKEDPIKLKIALKRAREDMTAVTVQLNEMIANYGDVIPRRDFESLTKEHEVVKNELSQLQTDNKQLMTEHDTLLQVHNQVIQQRDQFYTELETLKRSATPRPDWGRCGEVISGGEEKWQELSKDKTSDERVEVLLQIISGVAAAEDFYEGWGTGDDVPKYLQHEGMVKRLKWNRSQAVAVIKELWEEKMKADGESEAETRQVMADFVTQYLTQKLNNDPTAVLEYFYNLQDACETYDDNPFDLFYGVLTGEIDEERYYQEMDLFSKLRESLQKADEEMATEGLLPRDLFEKVLKDNFPIKDDDVIQELMDTALTELNSDDPTTMKYQDLFLEDEEGKNGPFLAMLRRQEHEERTIYVEQIKKELGEKEEVPLKELRIAIAVVDAEIDKVSLLSYLSRAFNLHKDLLNDAEPQPIDVILKRLSTGAVRRIGKLNTSDMM
ncbi:translin-associated factor X-interacting protein 1-like isoform X2 [Anneissia japonica]|uniref:translin-associated factor X-interacting protein 1-like isoform X2 n=1 Tax=Anneissia japonica TaxID=1529436 RepID=UPI0014255FC1|nr:translin-associated factor X-interacting protein 1-like isoform X2 [Anneissia japonica]